ncbi:MAG: hypothetical protein LBG61_07370 [Burkholderiales bacterium]|nr:hypothetical protein [Burkholderiales bacterium]
MLKTLRKKDQSPHPICPVRRVDDALRCKGSNGFDGSDDNVNMPFNQ